MEFGAMKINVSVYRRYEGSKCSAELQVEGIKRIGEVLYVEVEKGIPFQYSSIPNIMSILTQDLEGNEETSLVLNRNFPSSEYRSLTTPHMES